MEKHLIVFGQKYHHETTYDQCKIYATELMENLGYVDWAHFESFILRAIDICEHIDIETDLHFRSTFRNAEGQVWKDYRISPLACYLIAANGDSQNPSTGRAQVYFMKKFYGEKDFNLFAESIL